MSAIPNPLLTAQSRPQVPDPPTPSTTYKRTAPPPPAPPSPSTSNPSPSLHRPLRLRLPRPTTPHPSCLPYGNTIPALMSRGPRSHSQFPRSRPEPHFPLHAGCSRTRRDADEVPVVCIGYGDFDGVGGWEGGRWMVMLAGFSVLFELKRNPPPSRNYEGGAGEVVSNDLSSSRSGAISCMSLFLMLDCSCGEELEPQSCRPLVYIFAPRPPSGQIFSQHTSSSFLAPTT